MPLLPGAGTPLGYAPSPGADARTAAAAALGGVGVAELLAGGKTLEEVAGMYAEMVGGAGGVRGGAGARKG